MARTADFSLLSDKIIWYDDWGLFTGATFSVFEVKHCGSSELNELREYLLYGNLNCHSLGSEAVNKLELHMLEFSDSKYTFVYLKYFRNKNKFSNPGEKFM